MKWRIRQSIKTVGGNQIRIQSPLDDTYDDIYTARHALTRAAQEYVRHLAVAGYVCEYMRSHLEAENQCQRELKVCKNGAIKWFKVFRIEPVEEQQTELVEEQPNEPIFEDRWYLFIWGAGYQRPSQRAVIEAHQESYIQEDQGFDVDEALPRLRALDLGQSLSLDGVCGILTVVRVV